VASVRQSDRRDTGKTRAGRGTRLADQLRMLCRIGLALVVLAGIGAPARADDLLHVGVASEFGRGVGAGLELGTEDTVVLGAGAAFGIGYSSVSGWLGSLSPGIAAGVRHHIGGWFIGPSLGLNYHALASAEMPVEADAFQASAMADLGYRWWLGASDDVVLRAGVSVGLSSIVLDSRGETEFDPVATGAFTLSVGWLRVD
jgi:hypothetical protein